MQFSKRPVRKTTPVIIDDQGQALYVIEGLRKCQSFGHKKKYLVKWAGFGEEENTWEWEKDIKHVKHWKALLQEFKRELEVGRGRM